jgi:xanthine/CO dehydrogenase XdhC/CoxF family maturation factor
MPRVAWVLIGVGALGCQRTAEEAAATRGSGSSTGSASRAGRERGDCRPDKGCDPGLLCLSDLCVRPPAADCIAVAESLASLELGNYAPREQRAAVVAVKRAACETAMVSKDEGKCLDAAHDKYAVAACVPRMFPDVAVGSGSAGGSCDAIAARMRALIAKKDPAQDKMIAAATAVVRASCAEDGWPESFKQCLLASVDADMRACESQMPPGLQQRMQDRMRKTMAP